MPDHRNGTPTQDEVIRKGYGFGPLLRQTQRNNVARNEMKMKMKRCLTSWPPRTPGAGKAGTFSWGAGESFIGRSSPAPPPSPCATCGFGGEAFPGCKYLFPHTHPHARGKSCQPSRSIGRHRRILLFLFLAVTASRCMNHMNPLPDASGWHPMMLDDAEMHAVRPPPVAPASPRFEPPPPHRSSNVEHVLNHLICSANLRQPASRPLRSHRCAPSA